MADDVRSRLESALKTLLDIKEKSGNLRKDLKQDIVDSVSTLRNIFVNLRNSGEEKTKKINQLLGELKKQGRSSWKTGLPKPRGAHCHLRAT